MILLEGLHKSYGPTRAVVDLNLSVAAGEIFGFLGPNGAGKTTTIRILNGLVRPTKGIVRLGGIDVVENSGKAKAMVGYVPDRPFLYEKLTGREFLVFVGGLYGIDRPTVLARAEKYLDCFEMHRYVGQMIEGYSHGMKQKLMFAASLLHEPPIFIVDEPMVGLDPKSARVVQQLFKEMAARGVAVLISTHTLSLVQALCHRVGIIHRGRMIALDTVANLMATANMPGSNLEEVFLKLTEEATVEEG